MKTYTTVISIIVVFVSFSVANAQDKIITLSKDTLSVEIVESSDDALKFKYPNENSISVLSKEKLLKAIYKSGRIENYNTIKQLPKISGKEDWQKVIVTFDANEIKGLTKCGEVTGKSGWGGVVSVPAGKSAIKDMQKDAARLGAGIILITKGWDEKKDKPISGYGRGVKLVASAYK